ncbi:ArnT family glycosyltransferase [Streptomyces sp. NPDC018019]|uniref:ArnT family glycosyltransferase n=1 Tax=Streptomyces sp. NPDC018019 TaxID=3365030 RepID=UPI00378EF9A1
MPVSAFSGTASLPGGRPRRRREFWRSPEDQPRWARPALLGIAALAGLLYAWNITSSGLAPYYSVAARSMTESWKAFLFTAYDPAATITLDKIGGFLWPQALSARLFGFHAWALTLPQCIEGVISVLVMYRVVRRWQGAAAGLLAAGLLTLTPVTASMFGHAIPDAALFMCLLLAVDRYQKAVGGARLRSLVWAGVWVGLAFQAKMMQAWLIVPALALGYGAAAPARLRTRAGHLLVAGAVTGAVSLSWVLMMTLTPVDVRPYVDGSTDNSALSMVFGYNGVGRLGSGARESGAKLLLPGLAAQCGWLFPLAVSGLACGAVRRGRRFRSGYLMWACWLLVTAAVLSLTAVPHRAYTAVLVPALVALSATGVLTLWRLYRAGRGWFRFLLPAAVGCQAAWAVYIAHAYRGFAPWLVPVAAAAAVAGVTLLVLIRPGPVPGPGAVAVRGRALAGLLAGCVAMFAAPVTWSLSVLNHRYAGSAFDAAAGPRGPGRVPPYAATLPGAFLAGPNGEVDTYFTSRLTPAQQRLLAYVRRHNGGARYLLSADRGWARSKAIAATGLPVLPLGGFTHESASVPLAAYQKLVASGRLRFALLDDTAVPRAGRDGQPTESTRISAWVRSACPRVAVHLPGTGPAAPGLSVRSPTGAPAGAPGLLTVESLHRCAPDARRSPSRREGHEGLRAGAAGERGEARAASGQRTQWRT